MPSSGGTIDAIESTYRGKNVLVTGHTGFKGAWLGLWLSELGAQVFGLSLPPNQPDGIYTHVRGSIFREDVHGDIVDPTLIAHMVKHIEPDYVFHLAAQPLVRQSYADPLGTLATNVMGSARLLEAVRGLQKTCHTIFVTSDKCYQNREWFYSYREIDRLGGKDPYSMSKAAAELVAESWRRSYFDHHPCGSSVISVRAGNVIGGGDYSADRLVPDCVRAALARKPLVIRSPKATRPWQHVLDCLHGYLVAGALAPKMERKAEAESFNFGPEDPHAHPVAEVAQAFFSQWSEATPGVVFEPGEKTLAEAGYLSVSIEKAQRMLGWQPVWKFATAIQETAAWYVEKHLRHSDMLAYSKQQLAQFVRAARER